MKRRAFLSLMGAAPLAGRAVANDIAKQAGILASGLGGPSVLGGLTGGQSLNAASLPNMPGKAQHEVWREAFNLYPALRGEQESTFYEQERVGVLDPDIAVYRSFSMAAKITFQKQRNVARRMDEMQSPPWWQKTEGAFRKIAALLK